MRAFVEPSPMKLRFSKMHGAGNDFVVLDGVRQRVDLGVDQIRWIARRQTGVGCDQLLIVESARIEGADFRYRIFNADGGEVEQCGSRGLPISAKFEWKRWRG